MADTLAEIRKFICFNQKELMQYEYVISERHKELRKCNEDISFNEQELSNKIDDLLNDAYWNLVEIFIENTTYINEIFESIGIIKEPRITIKTLENGTVMDFFRSHTYSNLAITKIEDNTGFSKIMNSKKTTHFLSNNLKKDFEDDNYINPRIKNDCKEALKNGDISWEECWTPINKEGEVFSYMSTLIIPMAIKIDNIVDNEMFLKKFSKNVITSDQIRTFWGFLCFDYEDKDVFKGKEEILVDVGYIMADILSLYLMFFYNHITGSDTYKKASKKLNKK